MTGRSRSHDRCPRCRLRPTLCLCAELPRLQSSTRLVVVMHRLEARHTTNTGRLAALALPGSAVYVRGDPSRPIPDEALSPPEGEALLLYPDADAEVLDHSLAASLARPVTLIVPDGNWRQARRTGRREPALQGLRRVKLGPGEPSAYQLRQGVREDGLSTLEAIARALGVLEGTELQGALEALFHKAVTRVLWSRGRIPLDACEGAIPEAAIEEARASGRRARPE